MANYTIKQGDCIESIAHQYGYFWKTLWSHPENAELERKRKNPNVVYPGDVVFIPNKRLKEESAATEQHHVFTRKGVPSKFRIVVREAGKPRANERYILKIDGETFSGATDAEGLIEQIIPPNARRARVLLGDEQYEYLLDLGHLDPIEEISGVQARLNNLGFDCGDVDGVIGPKTEKALKQFQRKHDLEESGKIDEQTQDKLEEVYGF